MEPLHPIEETPFPTDGMGDGGGNTRAGVVTPWPSAENVESSRAGGGTGCSAGTGYSPGFTTSAGVSFDGGGRGWEGVENVRAVNLMGSYPLGLLQGQSQSQTHFQSQSQWQSQSQALSANANANADADTNTNINTDMDKDKGKDKETKPRRLPVSISRGALDKIG